MIRGVLTTDDLKALVERARQVDPDAWEAIYRHAYARLHSYARRRLADDHQADDAVSEAMARAIDRIDDFTWSGAGLDAWLFGILRNVVRETYRHGSRHPLVDVTERAPVIDVAAGPAARLVAEETADEVRAAFARLPEDDREVLELRLVQRLDAASVGEILGRGAGAIRMAQSRALDRLRALMVEEVR